MVQAHASYSFSCIEQHATEVLVVPIRDKPSQGWAERMRTAQEVKVFLRTHGQNCRINDAAQIGFDLKNQNIFFLFNELYFLFLFCKLYLQNKCRIKGGTGIKLKFKVRPVKPVVESVVDCFVGPVNASLFPVAGGWNSNAVKPTQGSLFKPADRKVAVAR